MIWFVFKINKTFYLWKKNITDTKAKVKYFAGSYQDKEDTILLSFYKNYFPENMSNILIKDTLNKIAHYPITNSAKYYLLKIWRGAYIDGPLKLD